MVREIARTAILNNKKVKGVFKVEDIKRCVCLVIFFLIAE